MDKTYNILSTALLPQAEMLMLASQGFDCDSIPFIQTDTSISSETEICIQELAKRNALVIFTSVQAVKAVQECCKTIIPDWEVYCISGATRKAVISFLGEEKIIATANDAIDLVKEISRCNIQEIIFFCGNKRLDTLSDLLSKKGFRVKECEVYQTTLTPIKIEKKYNGILFFSPSGIESFLALNVIPENCTLFSIGKTTAKVLADKLQNEIIIAPQPDKNILVNTVIEFYKNHKK